MKIRIGALLAVTGLAAHAERPNWQWKPMNTTMFDVAQNGYTLASVFDAPTSKGSVRTFFWQKDHSVIECVEVHEGRPALESRCNELVKPYVANSNGSK